MLGFILSLLLLCIILFIRFIVWIIKLLFRATVSEPPDIPDSEVDRRESLQYVRKWRVASKRKKDAIYTDLCQQRDMLAAYGQQLLTAHNTALAKGQLSPVPERELIETQRHYSNLVFALAQIDSTRQALTKRQHS